MSGVLLLEERGISPRLGIYLKTRCLHIASTAPGHFDYCRKLLFHPISTPALLSHTVICIFSLGSLTHISVHPATPVIHLFFPLVSFPSVFVASPQPHLHAQPGMSSLPALGIFTRTKKCNHPFLLTPSHSNSRWHKDCLHAIIWVSLFPAGLDSASVYLDISFTFM